MGKIVKFKDVLVELSKEELDVIKVLEKVGEAVQKIWLKQYDPKTQELLVYSAGLSEISLKKLAEKNPLVKSPYTVVKTDKTGKIDVVDYIQEYSKEIDEIVKGLRAAESLTSDENLKKLLNALARDFEKGDFDAVTFDNLKYNNSHILLIIGPHITFADSIFGVKKVFQFSLGISDLEKNNDFENQISVCKEITVLRPIGSRACKMSIDEVKVFFENVYMLAGHCSLAQPSSINLPKEPQMCSTNGAIIIFNENIIKERAEILYSTAVESVFTDKHEYTMESMSKGFQNLILFHELSETLVKYPDASKRLGNYYNSIIELNAFLMSIQIIATLAFKGAMDFHDYRDAMVAWIAYGILAVRLRATSGFANQFARGYAIVFNYGIGIEAVAIKENRLHIKFEDSSKIDPIAEKILELYSNGTEKEAKWLFDIYEDYSVIDDIFVFPEKD